MEELIKAYEILPDVRQEVKIKHKLIDIVIITILATFGNTNEWEDIEIWGNENEKWLNNYLTLKNGIPSHDTIQRNIAIIDTETINIIFLISKYNVDKLVYYESTNESMAAIEREKEIKGWKRAKKDSLIKEQNPEWKDLYDEIIKNT